MSLATHAAAAQPSTARTTARHWFATAEAFEQVCIRARDQAARRTSDFDRELAAETRFAQLRHGLDAPLRASALVQLCRIAGVDVPRGEVCS